MTAGKPSNWADDWHTAINQSIPICDMPRKIVQLFGVGDTMYALADDGTIWLWQGGWKEARESEPLPVRVPK